MEGSVGRVQQGGRSGPAAWSVCLGPGNELEDLGPVLVHLSRAVNNGVDVQITTLGDLAGLMTAFAGRGRLILQGDNFPDEDIGFVRRFLVNNPHWSLVLVGKDAGTRPARVILGMDRTRWLALPPDLDQMRELVRYPSVPEPPSWERKEEESEVAPPPPPAPATLVLPPQEQAPAPRSRVEPASPAAAPAPVRPLSPGTPVAPPEAAAPTQPPPQVPQQPARAPAPAAAGPFAEVLAAAPPDPLPTPLSADRTLQHAPSEQVSPEPARADRAPTTAPTEPPAGAGLDAGEMRAQVAALADIAQRLELSIESGEGTPPGLGAPDAELARLRRFTHMLGHVTSPPGRGAESFDLGDLLEEKLAAAALSGPRSTRFLPKGERGLRVLADQGAVATALEALIDLARTCARPNGVIKAPYRRGADGQCEVVLDFPAGPLADADPARALRPGGVQQELPDLGPADLPAAAALIGGQGGTLRIEAGGDLRLRVLLELPAHDA